MPEATVKRVLDTVRLNRNVPYTAVRGDYGSRFINAVIAVDGVPLMIDMSCAVTINAKRSDRQSKGFPGEVNPNGTVTVPVTQWMLDIPNASVECTISIAGASTKLSTNPFNIETKETPYSGTDISEEDPEYDVLMQVLAGEAARNAAETERVNAELKRAAAEADREKKLAAFGDDIFKLKYTDEVQSELLGDHERRLLVLESGVVAGYQTDKTAAYQKTVPANALGYAQLEASGVVSKVVKSSNLWRGVTEFTLNAPYEVGVKKAIGTVSLPAGIYYVSGTGDFGSGMMLSDDMGRLVLGESDSRWLTLESEQTVTVYAVVYEDFAVNGSEFESVSFAPIGVFSVSYEGAEPSYERPFDPYIKTTVLKSIQSKDSAGANTVTYTVPDNIVELQKSLIYKAGGESGDYIDWVNDRAVKHYKTVDLGDLEWTFRNTTTPYWRGTLSGESVGNGAMVLSDVYNEVEAANPFPDRSWFATNSQIWIRDSRYTDAAAFKEAVRGTMLYYVSDTPEYTDIDLGDFDGFIKVSPSGTLVFVNDDNAAIPTTVTYQLKEE